MNLGRHTGRRDSEGKKKKEFGIPAWLSGETIL